MELTANDIVKRIAQLPTDQALVFKLKTFHNLSANAIADKMTINSDNVWQLLHKARVSLMR